MARQRVQLAFSEGLEREAGGLAVRPGTFQDALNVVPALGKVRRRGGYTLTSTLVYTAEGDKLDAPGDMALGVFRFHAEGAGIAVGYRAADRSIHVNRISGTGTSPSHLGEWFKLDADAAFPPRIVAAESYGKLFLAHDEGSIARRAHTVYYDRSTGLLHDLRAKLRNNPAPDPGESEPHPDGELVRFRGVVRHLSYMLGWGFGHAGEDRPELVRASEPGEPTRFVDTAYWIAGQRGDPVLACQPLAGGVAVLKPAEKYSIFGTSYQNFGILPGEELFGVASSRLAVSVGGVLYVWSQEGPRLHTGQGASISISRPLGMPRLDAGRLEAAFAVYDPLSECVLFVMGHEVWALYVGDPTDPRWVEWGFGHEMLSGGILYSGGVVPDDASPGTALLTGATDSGVDPDNHNLRRLDVTWTNQGMVGDEMIEVYRRIGAGPWELVEQVPVSPTAAQIYTLWSLPSGRSGTVAVRARRGNNYGAGYESPNPDNWPPDALVGWTTSVRAPSLSTHWERVSASVERVRLTISGDPAVHHRIVRSVDGGTWSEVGVALPGENFDYNVPAVESERTLRFQAVPFTGDLPAGQASNVASQWSGPPPPSAVSTQTYALPDYTFYGYRVSWDNAGPYQTEVEDDRSGIYLQVPGSPASPGTTSLPRYFDDGEPHAMAQIRLRHRMVSHGVADYSAWVDTSSGIV